MHADDLLIDISWLHQSFMHKQLYRIYLHEVSDAESNVNTFLKYTLLFV